MTSLLVILVVAVAGGAAIAVQAQLAGGVSDRVGTLEAVFITYGIGGLLSGALMLLVRGGNLGQVRHLPAYIYLAGAFGLVIVGAISFSVGRLGVVRGLLLVTVAQFVVSAAIDQFGWFGAEIQPLTLAKASGITLLLAGGWLVLR
jgi:transporter family-2 protein